MPDASTAFMYQSVRRPRTASFFTGEDYGYGWFISSKVDRNLTREDLIGEHVEVLLTEDLSAEVATWTVDTAGRSVQDVADQVVELLQGGSA